MRKDGFSRQSWSSAEPVHVPGYPRDVACGGVICGPRCPTGGIMRRSDDQDGEWVKWESFPGFEDSPPAADVDRGSVGAAVRSRRCLDPKGVGVARATGLTSTATYTSVSVFNLELEGRGTCGDCPSSGAGASHDSFAVDRRVLDC